MSKLKRIDTPQAPTPVGSYSQAIIAGDFIFCAGQIGIDPLTSKLVSDDFKQQTKQVLENLKNVLAAAGCSFEDVVRADPFLINMANYAKFNEIYSSYFTNDPPPARQTVVVSALPAGAKVEISVIAYAGKQ